MLFEGSQLGMGATIFFVVGLILKFSGFTVRDELRLRIMVASGLCCDACYYLLRPEPIMTSVMSNLSLMTVNVALIVLIVTERTRWGMSEDQKRVFGHFGTLTPGQFRRLYRVMTQETVTPDARLTQEGAQVDDLMLVFAERILIGKSGTSFPIAGPAFVGEIALLTGNRSSADVTVPDGGTVYRIPFKELRRRMARSPALHNAMVALFGAELARKVADSVPMDRAARGRAAPKTDPLPDADPKVPGAAV